jgi:hypothetical protein
VALLLALTGVPYMPTTARPTYGAVVAIPITLAGLATGVGRQSSYVDNTLAFGLDALVTLKWKFGAGAGGGSVDVYAYGSFDGANFIGQATGSDSIYTPTALQALQLRKLDSVAAPPAGFLYTGNFSMSAAFGVVPMRWGIIVHNNATGVAFDATPANFVLQYAPQNIQSV